MQKIRNIIFDLGGVLLGIDFNRSIQAFKEMGVTQYDRQFSQHHAGPLFRNLETGKISPATFYDRFRKDFQVTLTDEQIKSAWDAMLLHFSPEKMLWLNGLRDKYRLFLFSNTNLIHQQYFEALFEKEVPGRPFRSYFVKAYYSHLLGLRKPDAAAFESVIKEQGLVPGQTLFVDDTIGNIEGARQVGLSTFFLDKTKNLQLTDIPL